MKKSSAKELNRYEKSIKYRLYDEFGGIMGSQPLKEERYADIDEIISESFTSPNMTEEKTDMVLEYLCQTISNMDSYDEVKQKANKGDTYAYIQLASWHVSHAENVKDYCEALKYAAKAVKYGYNEAYYILGQLYLYGAGCEKNLHKAVRYLTNFVTKISKDELLNDYVLVDAYIKLAETEKKLGHLKKSCMYYEKLQKIRPQYENDIEELHQEISERNNSICTYTIGIAMLALFVCGSIYFVTQKLVDHTQTFAMKYPEKDKVTAEIEPESVALEAQPEASLIELEEPLSYRIVDKATFDNEKMLKLDTKEVKSSSESDSNDHGPGNLTDGSVDTYWQENEDDSGIGQTITFDLNEPAIINGMSIINGNQTSDYSYYENNRIASFGIFDDPELVAEIDDTFEEQYIIFENPIRVDEINLKIKSVYSGTEHNNTCITQITFYE